MRCFVMTLTQFLPSLSLRIGVRFSWIWYLQSELLWSGRSLRNCTHHWANMKDCVIDCKEGIKKTQFYIDSRSQLKVRWWWGEGDRNKKNIWFRFVHVHIEIHWSVHLGFTAGGCSQETMRKPHTSPSPSEKRLRHSSFSFQCKGGVTSARLFSAPFLSSLALSVWMCVSSLHKLLRGSSIYSSLKCEPIMSTVVTE